RRKRLALPRKKRLTRCLRNQRPRPRRRQHLPVQPSRLRAGASFTAAAASRPILKSNRFRSRRFAIGSPKQPFSSHANSPPDRCPASNLIVSRRLTIHTTCARPIIQSLPTSSQLSATSSSVTVILEFNQRRLSRSWIL